MSLKLSPSIICLVFSLILTGITCKRPNFVIFLVDDLDLHLDSMMIMKSTIENIANDGLTFTNAYVHTPICCPSRSSILTGKYLHNLKVFNNSLNGNCSSVEWQTNHEPKSFAAYLKSEGYVNFYAGKYLNQYGNKHANGLSHIPTGYDWWYGLEGNSKYYNFSLSMNGTKVDFHKEYLTDLMASFAEKFLNEKPQDKEFMMVLATPAAHAPFTPAARHMNQFPEVKARKTPNFNASTAKKHWLVQLPPEHLPPNIDILDELQRKRMQTLLSVDEMVQKVVDQLKKLKQLDDTYLIFTSDNGFHIGQFGLPWDKRQPYQTDIHIPFLMRGPNMPKKDTFNFPISLVDLAPTILSLANVDVPNDMDGVSFHKLLNFTTGNNEISNENMKDVRKFVYIEYFGEGNANSVQKECNFSEEDAQNLSECSLQNWCKCQDSRNNTYHCVMHFDPDMIAHTIKYCMFQDNKAFLEVYDLVSDPFELNNKAPVFPKDNHEYYTNLLMKHKKCHGKSCQPQFFNQKLSNI